MNRVTPYVVDTKGAAVIAAFTRTRLVPSWKSTTIGRVRAGAGTTLRIWSIAALRAIALRETTGRAGNKNRNPDVSCILGGKT